MVINDDDDNDDDDNNDDNDDVTAKIERQQDFPRDGKRTVTLATKSLHCYRTDTAS